MSRVRIPFPQVIDPSLIEIGDEISVHHKKDQGVEHILRGIVGKRIDSGNVRYLCTEEGATLLAWEPSRVGITVMKHSYETKPHDTLFDIAEVMDPFASNELGELKKRIAS
jgi:hypothetical protein